MTSQPKVYFVTARSRFDGSTLWGAHLWEFSAEGARALARCKINQDREIAQREGWPPRPNDADIIAKVARGNSAHLNAMNAYPAARS